MKLTYHSFCNQRNGFLLIELLLALALLGSIGLIIGLYQTKVQLYRQAAAQLYQAMNIASSSLEQLRVGLRPMRSHEWQDQIYQIDLQVNSNMTWQQIVITVSWQNVFDKKQSICWEGVCLNPVQV